MHTFVIIVSIDAKFEFSVDMCNGILFYKNNLHLKLIYIFKEKLGKARRILRMIFRKRAMKFKIHM